MGVNLKWQVCESGGGVRGEEWAGGKMQGWEVLLLLLCAERGYVRFWHGEPGREHRSGVRWAWDLEGEGERQGEWRGDCIKLSYRQFGFIRTHVQWIVVKRRRFSML